MRSTHTYAILEISPEAHAEIKAKLLDAGYGHAIDGDLIDMAGLAVKPMTVDGAIITGGMPYRTVCCCDYDNGHGSHRPGCPHSVVEPSQSMIVDEQAFNRP